MGRFDGAWEEKGVIGPRVEIEGENILFLWQASPVLETSFEVVQDGGKIVLKLEHNGLRNDGSLDPYAVINECYYDGSALVIDADYRFSGVSEAKLYPTTNNRYGNVTLVNNEILPLLEGKWESKYTDLVFEGSTLSIFAHDGKKAENVIQVVAARSNSCASNEVMILDKDPAKQGIDSFYKIVYLSGVIKAYIEVCDDKPIEVLFTKKQ